ncbi:hypothetical protein F5880DRAFT_909584 [Lentinula raphanica]|nr:hypothetical protein F5880DRAFT_909584 [Lentinula raphanica]
MIHTSFLQKLSSALLLLLCVLSLVTAQSSSTSSTSSSSSASAISSGSSGSISASTTIASGGSGSSLSASSTSSAVLPSLSGYDTCVVTCFETAIASVNCSNVVPESCYCNSTNYQSALVSCMQSDCPSELITAEGLTNQFCALASTSTSISFSITSLPSSSSVSSTASNNGSSTVSVTTTTSNSASSGSSTGTSNAALGNVLRGGLNQAAMPSLLVAAVGVLAGAFLVR